MLTEFIEELRQFTLSDPDILTTLIVGSCARGTNTPSSDVDVVIITNNKPGMVADQRFTEQFGTVSRSQTEYYGACTSVRVWYDNGLEVEFGLVEPSWMDRPLDAGTHRVLSDGYKIVEDKGTLFQNLKL